MANELSISRRHESVLSEEEICDVSLATFHVFDKENAEAPAARHFRGGPCIQAPTISRHFRGGPCIQAPTISRHF
jgi:hypothetical protein